MTGTVSISNLIQDLSTRSGRAILSQLGLRSPALREYLAKLYARRPGEPGALLADPVLEAAFGWEAAEEDMRKLARSGLLRDELVSAMDKPPREFRRDYRFPKDRKPFQHQIECWRHLLDDVPRSVLVTSGTGSGKTECFLVPILEDLARERARGNALAGGVRALFMYPLNALINSQRDRLRAWSGHSADCGPASIRPVPEGTRRSLKAGTSARCSPTAGRAVSTVDFPSSSWSHAGNVDRSICPSRKGPRGLPANTGWSLVWKRKPWTSSS